MCSPKVVTGFLLFLLSFFFLLFLFFLINLLLQNISFHPWHSWRHRDWEIPGGERTRGSQVTVHWLSHFLVHRGGLCGCLQRSDRWGGWPWHLCLGLIPQLSLERAQDVIQLLVHLHDLLRNQRADELSDGCKCFWWEAFQRPKPRKKPVREHGHLRTTSSLTFVQPAALEQMTLQSHKENGRRRTEHGWPEDSTQPFCLSAFSQGWWWWCILQISALKLPFTLRFIVNVFFPVPLPAFTTLGCRTSCFPLLSREMKQPPLPSHCK